MDVEREPELAANIGNEVKETVTEENWKTKHHKTIWVYIVWRSLVLCLSLIRVLAYKYEAHDGNSSRN